MSRDEESRRLCRPHQQRSFAGGDGSPRGAAHRPPSGTSSGGLPRLAAVWWHLAVATVAAAALAYCID